MLIIQEKAKTMRAFSINTITKPTRVYVVDLQVETNFTDLNN